MLLWIFAVLLLPLLRFCVVVDLVVVVTLVAAWALTVRPVAMTNAVSVVANFFLIVDC